MMAVPIYSGSWEIRSTWQDLTKLLIHYKIS